MRTFCRVTVMATLVLISGCNVLYPPMMYPPAAPIDRPPPPKKNGTVYQAGYDVHLYEDPIASRVGDILTVRLEEGTKGEYRAQTRTNKLASLDYPVPIVFGQSIPAMEVQTDTEQVFDSRGDSNQSGKLFGTMSVTVVRVLANHNLMVQGETWVTINQGQDYLQLTGIVRPQDIGPNNVVSSQRIAGAQIKFGARGQAGYATQGGLFTRIFNRFYPY
ncbi:flagellar basal body L-ring protein FlgH [Legionella geestiana]|nr:flagellar basal body L-ring protein FlgH [Legionella geestiana]QDQ40523.1 flagellar basal body L-ring protein FlgH [Legionella geestiana]